MTSPFEPCRRRHPRVIGERIDAREAAEMKRVRSFKFVNDGLNRKPLALLKQTRVKHRIDAGGAVPDSVKEEEAVENDRRFGRQEGQGGDSAEAGGGAEKALAGGHGSHL
jgi:hypothetical protein